MARLVFDIETVGEDWESLDETSQHILSRWIKKEYGESEGYEAALDDLKNGLGFSPLTGEIVAIGVLDVDKNHGAVYYQAPGDAAAAETKIEAGNASFLLKPMSEKEMLEAFWRGAEQYTEFISYNGRSFDAPFLALRSAIHGIRPSRNLLEGRYPYQQRSCRHVDLQDEFTFYGAVARKGGLHMYSRAFGIKSPKADGTSGDDVARLFREKKFLEIAKYNTGDLLATRDLYDRWDKYVKF